MGLLGGFEITTQWSEHSACHRESAIVYYCVLICVYTLGMRSKNMFVFPMFTFMWNNNSSRILSVYVPDPGYIWRCMHMRMLMWSEVHVCVYMHFPFDEN